VKAGFVGTITLKVPWKSLGKEPVIVLIDRLFVLAHPAPDGQTLKEEDREKLFEAKLQQIEVCHLPLCIKLASSLLPTLKTTVILIIHLYSYKVNKVVQDEFLLCCLLSCRMSVPSSVFCPLTFCPRIYVAFDFILFNKTISFSQRKCHNVSLCPGRTGGQEVAVTPQVSLYPAMLPPYTQTRKSEFFRKFDRVSFVFMTIHARYLVISNKYNHPHSLNH
jgi:hypothetical protein